MSFAVRRLAACLLCCGSGLVVFPAMALGGGSSSEVSLEGTNTSSSLTGSLVIPGSPTERDQRRSQEEAQLSSPEAVARREASRTKYENLNTEQAVQVAGEAFPVILNEPAGGPPKLPAGETITGFPADNSAQVDLGEGRHAAIESVQPMAIETSTGERIPIDLGLTESAGSFQPTTPAVNIVIPKQLGKGVQLAKTEVSFTPVDATGAPLGGSNGAVDGVSVLYSNTGTDQDTLVKPTTAGFEVDTLLRSVESPEQLYFRVGLPEGASLVRAKEGPETVAVMKDGAVIAVLPRPSARDATGRSVPVSMTLSGGEIVLTVGHRTGEYTYPVEVDPTVTDWPYESGVYNGYNENWLFYNGSGPQFTGGIGDYAGAKMDVSTGQPYSQDEWAYMYYLTKGISQIYTWHAKTESWTNGHENDADMFIYSEKGLEGSATVLPRNGTTETTVCALSGCAVPVTIESGRASNGAFFEAYAEQSGTYPFEYSAWETSVGIVQYAGPSASFDTADQFIEGYPNPLYGGGQWVKDQGRLEFDASDPGTGVNGLSWKSPNASGWGSGIGSQVGQCKGGVQCLPCIGPQCTSSDPLPPLAHLGGLPDGEDTVELTAHDGVGMTSTATATVKIDSETPHSITLAGLPPGNEVGDGQNHELKFMASATDGSGSVASSGVASLALSLDGKSIGSPSGSCSPGPCTATSSEWTLNTEQYGAGKHTLTVTATDKAGNVANENFTLTIHHASPVALGPGSVNPLTGEFYLSAVDVSVAGSGTAMTVGRNYNSRHLTAGSEGPLGPQWSMNVSGQQSIVKLPNGSVVSTNSVGQQATFTSTGGGNFASPQGDASLTLTETTIKEARAYRLKSGGTVTTFEHPAGGSENVWMPAVTEGTGGTNASTFTFQTVEVEGKKITEPTEELAPIPSGVSCSPTLSKGCRALTFNYATSTTASGESSSEWGDYNGRLTRVYLTAWDPVKKEMTTSAIAQYAYDKLGRLRAAWNPLISPTLKTDYGYDSEGHVTAITSPGQESWALTYGTIAGDQNTGRLLKVMRPPATTPLWAGEAPKNTEAPKLTGKPSPGVRMAVSNGAWLHSPVTYGYQWEDCNREGKECVSIAGATNADYIPAESDVGHALVAEVIAINGGGSVVASTAASASVGTAEEYSLPTGSDPYGIASGSDGNLWFTELGKSKVGKITTAGAVTEYTGTTFPAKIAAGSDKNLWYTDLLTSKIGKITTSGTVTQYSLPEKSNPLGIAAGPDEDLWFADGGSSKIGKITTSGTITEYALPAGSEPMGITSGPDKNLWFTDQKTNKVGKITTSGTITEYTLPSGSGPSGIASGAGRQPVVH